MGVAYGQDLRDRVLAAYDRGMKTKQIADLFEVSSSWARRVKQRRRETGETAPRPRGGATVIKIDLDRLGELVKQLLRSLACRTRESLWESMQSVLDQVTPTDAFNCYEHCGYTLQMD